jgi:hypothetical protein
MLSAGTLDFLQRMSRLLTPSGLKAEAQARPSPPSEGKDHRPQARNVLSSLDSVPWHGRGR